MVTKKATGLKLNPAQIAFESTDGLFGRSHESGMHPA